MTFRSIISSLAVIAQLLLVISSASATSAPAAGRGTPARSKAGAAAAGAMIDLLSLPARSGLATVPQALCTILRHVPRKERSPGIVYGTGDVPRLFASSLRSSVLRYAVLLI